MIKIVKSRILELVSLGNITDLLIEKALEKYQLRMKNIKKLGDKKIKPHCLFDWIVLAENEDIKALSFIKFINQQSKELFNQVDPKFHPKIRSKLIEIVCTVETDVELPHNPSHLNFLAEFFGLNHILRVTEGRFKLEEIEKVLPNGKQSDFAFYDNETQELLYVDFVSIHNIDVGRLSGNADLIEFFEYRFNQKLASKIKNLNTNFNRIEIEEGKQVNFAILPIVWSEISELLPFQEAFETIDDKYANSFSCCTLLPEKLEDKSIHYSFCKVSHVLKRRSEISHL